jgi:hypothetical protein
MLFPAVAVILYAGAAAGGMAGGSGDFRWAEDIRRALGDDDLKPTEAFTYPLVRDAIDWLLAAAMVVELMIMRRQWSLFANGLPRLVRNGVLRPASGQLHDLFEHRQLPKWLATIPPEDRLFAYVDRVNSRNRRRAPIYTWLYAFTALVSAALLVSVERYRLFRILVPKGASLHEQEEWRRNVYQHWWASIHHPSGVATYFLLAAIVIYIVAAQTHIGVQAAQIAAALPWLVDVDANWINPDGEYGWRPVRQIFRTVWLSMALYGLVVSALALVLGLGSVGWIPATIWVLLLIIYVAVPWIAMGKIEEVAKENRIATAQTEIMAVTTKEQDDLETRVRKYREVRIRLMRLGRFERIPVALSVFLPVVLNLVQPYIQTYLFK